MLMPNKKPLIIFLAIACCFLLPHLVLAVVNSTGYAWGENAGWANFNSTNGGATVSSAGVTGYVWLENVGWIQVDYDGVAGAVKTTSTNWGITNDGSGNLGRYAWGENIGWINFHPTNSQVIISGGNFSGYAWSENIGWIKFDHAQTSDRPATTWTAVSAPTITISAVSLVESTTATLNGNVTATGGENPTVTVYWGDNDGGQGTWDNNATPPTSPAQPQGVDVFLQNVTGLSPGTTYYFSAKATNSGGTGWPAVSLSFLTKSDVPGTPILTVDSASQITATLTSDSNPAGTEYYIANTTSSTNSGWIATTAWTSSGLTCNTEYTFTVKARNSGAETETSSAVSATTSACPSSGGGSYVAGAFLPPASPLNGFQILINGGSLTTNNQDANLTLRGSNDN